MSDFSESNVHPLQPSKVTCLTFPELFLLVFFFRKFLGTICFIYIDMIESIGSTCMTISRLFITINKFDCKTIILALESPSDDDLSHHSVKVNDLRCW